MSRRGFTLIETILVISLMMTLTGVGYVVLSGILRSQSMVNAATLISSQIYVAQIDSYAQTGDTSHGVKVLPTAITRFRGDSYDMRDSNYDVTIVLPSNISISGNDEIVFSKGKITIESEIIITLLNTNKRYDITVSPYGIIDIE